jgi:hypothetical protein
LGCFRYSPHMELMVMSGSRQMTAQRAMSIASNTFPRYV